MFKRRILSISILVLVSLLMYGLAPFLLLLSLLLSLHRKFKTLPHALGFALGFLTNELVGLAKLTWVWARYRHHPEYRARNQVIQYRWAERLLSLGIKLYKLDFQVSGELAIPGPSALVISRHTSIADTVLPMLYFAQYRGEGMRYVLKKELMWMPCLDIAGHRLPNFFVDRSGTDTQRELAAVEELTRQASEQENLLVYPEGTRSTAAKREHLAREKPELTDQLARWPDLLPPRLGGVSAMLAANPGKDIVFLAHTGFEGSASPRDLMNGSWRHQVVRLHFWRVANSEIPDDHQKFVFENWDQMQHHVERLEALS